MIVRIEAHFGEIERDGWLCAELTGTYTVTRIDSSKRDVTRDELLALLKSEPIAIPPQGCPKCGAEGDAFVEEPDGTNRMCGEHGPYRALEPPEDIS